MFLLNFFEAEVRLMRAVHPSKGSDVEQASWLGQTRSHVLSGHLDSVVQKRMPPCAVSWSALCFGYHVNAHGSQRSFQRLRQHNGSCLRWRQCRKLIHDQFNNRSARHKSLCAMGPLKPHHQQLT